jgi:hypothetical protein
VTAAPKEYTRLPGRGRGFLGSSRLWLGPDHLLAVEGRGYSESYRRFYYRDIQAIVICRTHRWLVTSGLLALVLAPVVASFFSVSAEFRPFWAVPGAALLLIFLGNLIPGPTCAGRIMTGVQTASLPSLRRLRAARRAIERIRERVEQAQGAWIGLPVSEASQDVAPVPLPSRVSAASLPSAPPIAPVRRDNGRLHFLLFASLFADSGLTIAAITSKENAVYGAGVALLLVEIGLTIAAIVRQRRTDLPRSVRRIVWTALVYLCVSVTMTILMSWIAMFQALSAKTGATAPGGRILALDIFGVVAPLLLGMAGSLTLRRFLRDREEGELSLFGPAEKPGVALDNRP